MKKRGKKISAPRSFFFFLSSKKTKKTPTPRLGFPWKSSRNSLSSLPPVRFFDLFGRGIRGDPQSLKRTAIVASPVSAGGEQSLLHPRNCC